MGHSPRHSPLLAWFSLNAGTTGVYVASLGSLVVILARDLDRPETDLALLGPSYGVAMILGAFILPPVLRAGPATVLRFAPLLSLLGAGGMLSCNTVPGILASGLVLALGLATVYSAAPAVLIGPGARREITIMNGIASTCAAASPALYGGLEYLGVSGRWALAVTILPMLAVLARFWTRPALHPSRPQSGQVPALPETSAQTCPTPGGAVRDMKTLRGQDVAVALLRIALAVGGEFAFYVWGTARLVQTGADIALAAVLSTGFVLGMAVGRLGGLGLVARGGAMRLFASTAVLGSLIVIFSPVYPLVAVGFLVAGLGVSCTFPLAVTDLVRLEGLEARRAAALNSLISGVGIVLAPLALSALGSATSLQVAFGVLVLIYGLLAVLPAPGSAEGRQE